MTASSDTASSPKTIVSINPATGKPLGEVPVTSIDDLNQIAATAKEAQYSWAATPLKQRARILTTIRKAIVAHQDELSALIADETGKTKWEGFIEILTVAEHLRFVAGHGPSALRSHRRSSGILLNKRSRVNYLPHGVAGIISPWNYPLILTMAPIVEALMAGNSVVVKPSEMTPLTGKFLAEIIGESSLPDGLVNMIFGFGELGAALVDHPQVNAICFTGSVSVGRKIGARCGELLKPVILELGGKDPMLVMEDANLKRAAKAAVWGGFTNAGQTCISVERVYVHEKVADEFVGHLKKLTESLRTGADKENFDMGAIINDRQKGLIQNQIDEANRKSGVELASGQAIAEDDRAGCFLVPRVVEFPYTESGDTSDLMSKETFGPVLTVMRVPDEQSAIRLANGIGYGLSASVFTRNKKRGRRIASQLRSGSVAINDALSNYLCADLPFGGIGLSGIGRVHGKEGLWAFSQVQGVMEDRFGLPREPWWYPVPGWIQRLFRWFTRRWYG